MCREGHHIISNIKTFLTNQIDIYFAAVSAVTLQFVMNNWVKKQVQVWSLSVEITFQYAYICLLSLVPSVICMNILFIDSLMIEEKTFI